MHGSYALVAVLNWRRFTYLELFLFEQALEIGIGFGGSPGAVEQAVVC